MDRLVALLWPGSGGDLTVSRRPWPRQRDGPGYLVLPSRHDARLLIPAAHVSGWVRHTRPSHDETGWRGRLRRSAARALRHGAHHVLPVDRLQVPSRAGHPRRSFFDHVLDRTHIDADWMSVDLGVERPNQKPVLTFASNDRGPVAFAKIGWNPLSNRLVAHETAALGDAPADPPLVRPTLLDSGDWAGSNYLVMRALPHDADRDVPPEAIGSVVGAIAGEGTSGALTVRAWVRGAVHEALEELDASPRLEAVAAEIVDRHGDEVVRVGPSHGDFRPWNVAMSGDRVAVWDWERHGRERPVGVDAVHFHFPLPRHHPSVDGFVAAAHRGAARSAPLLRACGVSAEQVSTIRSCHALGLLARNALDRRISTTPVSRSRDDRLAAVVRSLG